MKFCLFGGGYWTIPVNLEGVFLFIHLLYMTLFDLFEFQAFAIKVIRTMDFNLFMRFWFWFHFLFILLRLLLDKGSVKYFLFSWLVVWYKAYIFCLLFFFDFLFDFPFFIYVLTLDFLFCHLPGWLSILIASNLVLALIRGLSAEPMIAFAIVVA